MGRLPANVQYRAAFITRSSLIDSMWILMAWVARPRDTSNAKFAGVQTCTFIELG